MEYRTQDALCGVYKITNNINDKVYIGQSINIKARWKDHMHTLDRNDSRCTLLQRAWNKYGKENFSFEILELCEEDMLDEVEMKYIAIYDSHNNGYNIELGGNKNKHLSEETKRKISDANRGRVHSEETLKKMSEARIGEKNPMYGQMHSEETRRKISEAHKGKPGHPTSEKTKELIRRANTGRIVSDETRKRISDATKGRVAHNKNLHPVFCVELNQVFNTASDAGKELNIKSSNIINCCEHVRKTCGGYHWEYADTISNYELIPHSIYFEQSDLTIQNE